MRLKGRLRKKPIHASDNFLDTTHRHVYNKQQGMKCSLGNRQNRFLS